VGEFPDVTLPEELFLPDEAYVPQVDQWGSVHKFANHTAMWQMTTEEVMEVDNATSGTILKALTRLNRGKDAGPEWDHLQRRPDLVKRPDVRADMKLLSQRNSWDPKNYYKSIGWARKGTNTKSPFRVTYPDFMAEGFIKADPSKPHENLPKKLQYKSLSTQLMGDEAIRLNLKRRFKKKMTLAGGWHEKKGKDGQPRVPDKTTVRRRPKAIPLKERSHKAMLNDAENARLLLEADDAYSEEDYKIAKRELPLMPSMGGTGKIHAPGEGPVAEKGKEKKRKSKLHKDARETRRAKRRVMGRLHQTHKRLGR